MYSSCPLSSNQLFRVPTPSFSFRPPSTLSECTTFSGNTQVSPSLSYPSTFPLSMSNHQLIFYRYSTNQDISRARQAFFKGSKSFLLVSERFHFYKRSVPPPFLIITANIDFAVVTKSEESVMSYSMDPQTTRSISRSTYHTPSLTRGWSRRM
jgi:hypothetical protein